MFWGNLLESSGAKYRSPVLLTEIRMTIIPITVLIIATTKTLVRPSERQLKLTSKGDELEDQDSVKALAA